MGVLENINFLKWFGKSAVRDAAGNPIRAYHGTDASFDAFDPKSVGRNFGSDVGYKKGFFFSNNPKTSDVTNWDIPMEGNPQTVPAYLSIKKPLEVNIKNGQTIPGYPGAKFNDPTVYYDNAAEQINRQAAKSRADGIIVRNTDTGEEMYVAFKPEQIKSPFNQGAFNPKDPNIMRSMAVPTGLLAGTMMLPDAARAESEALQEPVLDPTSLLSGPVRWGGGLLNMGINTISNLLTKK